jgi:hypothetical protein
MKLGTSLAFTLLCDFLRERRSPRRCLDMDGTRISTHDAERYYLGVVTAEEELAPLEERLLVCADCIERAEEARQYVETMRRALLRAQ